MDKIIVNKEVLNKELAEHFELLAEPIQMMMRKHNVEGAYEKLKEITRGQHVTEEQMSEFIETIDTPEGEKNILRKLKPWNYVGLAYELTHMLDELE